ncbi:MAG: murein biosynthesis integral membrane protein MurJ, partial [Desulfofundulus sp.]
ANRLTGLVPGVLGAAITTVMYPTLAQLAAENDWRRFSKAFAEAVKMINFVLIPVAVGMAVLRVPLIQLVFQRGAFDVQATQATAWALLFYSPVVAASSLCDMTSRAFFAFQDSRTPMVINTLGIGINIGLNLLLIGPLRHGGLALATSLATVFGACTLLWMLRVRLRMLSRSSANSLSNTDSHLPAEIGKGQHPRNDYSFADGPVGIGGKSILSSLWRVVLASALMGGVAWWSYVRLSFYVPGSNVALQAVRLLGAISAGTLSYGVAVWALGVPELQVAFDGAQQVWYKARSKIHDLRVGRKEDAAALKR